MTQDYPANLRNLVDRGVKAFEEHYNSTPTVCSVAPGRVNLIGEHVDYCDGFVMPIAIPLYTVIVGAPSPDSLCHVTSLNTQTEAQVTIDQGNLKKDFPTWANYVRGVMAFYGGKFKPFQAVIGSDVPLGGGLSSSASLEVATYTLLDALAIEKPEVTLCEKALVCQKAEHEYAGMPCGIMDQFISTMGQVGHALLIDCMTMKSEPVPLSDPDVVVLVTNSNVKHELTGSEYPERRKMCLKAAELMEKPSLRHATLDDLDVKMDMIERESSTMFSRAHHVITEIARTSKAAEVLKHGDYVTFGQLMLQSHESLRDDFEVSCPELDQLVELAMECNDVYGSRMTGGGFGGCTVTLCKKNAVNSVKEHIKKFYKGIPTFYECVAVGGTFELKL